MASVGEPADSSQSTFGAELLEGLTACAELVNTGRPADAELPDLAWVRDFCDRYAFYGPPAQGADLPALRAHRGCLDAAAAACEDGAELLAITLLNDLLADTGAVPQIVVHGGRGPHIHVARPTAPLADRIAAHLAMSLAQLVVSGQAGRLHSCAAPDCSSLFVDTSRNRSRRYCDSRTCGNRQHVAAYRARRAGVTASSGGSPAG